MTSRGHACGRGLPVNGSAQVVQGHQETVVLRNLAMCRVRRDADIEPADPVCLCYRGWRFPRAETRGSDPPLPCDSARVLAGGTAGLLRALVAQEESEGRARGERSPGRRRCDDSLCRFALVMVTRGGTTARQGLRRCLLRARPFGCLVGCQTPSHTTISFCHHVLMSFFVCRCIGMAHFSRYIFFWNLLYPNSSANAEESVNFHHIQE